MLIGFLMENCFCSGSLSTRVLFPRIFISCHSLLFPLLQLAGTRPGPYGAKCLPLLPKLAKYHPPAKRTSEGAHTRPICIKGFF